MAVDAGRELHGPLLRRAPRLVMHTMKGLPRSMQVQSQTPSGSSLRRCRRKGARRGSCSPCVCYVTLRVGYVIIDYQPTNAQKVWCCNIMHPRPLQSRHFTTLPTTLVCAAGSPRHHLLLRHCPRPLQPEQLPPQRYRPARPWSFPQRLPPVQPAQLSSGEASS